jgi:hypothetical protein
MSSSNFEYGDAFARSAVEESAMPRMERIREPLSQPFDEDYFKTRLKQGWRPVAIHWEREAEDEGPDQPYWIEDVPFGLRVSDDCVHLEEDPVERQAIELMLKLIAGDKSMSQIAAELNGQGLRTRNRSHWTQTAVFNMLPRLIEAAPQIWRRDYQQRKKT